MELRSCDRCRAELVEGARYCTSCGSRVAADAPPPPAVAEDASARLVECEVCGAGNAASRPLCARCGSPLREEVPGGDALPDQPTATPAAEGRSGRGRREAPSVLLSLVVLAGLVTAGVLLALVTSQVTQPDDPVVPTGVTLQAATASSALDGHPASLAVDGDTATAWTEAAPGAGVGEWIEVAMGADVSVRRVLIWGGDQRDEVRFAENGRPSTVRIEVADRQFRVALRPDLNGAQAVDLPEPVTADTLRIVVEEAVPGTRYADLAISEVVVEAGA